METLVEAGRDIVSDNDDIKDAESSENFEKFIHELFEQNGILNDLRAYLRGHIVNVLKNAETGNPPTCHKHFTQRLELAYQALNILIAEYLLKLEFKYSLSVFISEIPLQNMVFEFAKTILMSKDLNELDMRFGECDVWSVLNYLGIQCDSENAFKIVDMYNESKELPLLYCILKCITLTDKVPSFVQSVNTSDESFLSDITLERDDENNIKEKHRNVLNKCKHYAFCKTCQNRKKQLKHKYDKKVNKLEKIAKKMNLNNLNIDNFVNAVNVVEQNLIDEMFDQLKTVYEAEVEMVKEEGQKKIKRSIASHALLLQQHREQLEESYKEKEEKLEENIRQKKKFLWGLARALREQHECMTKAMMEVKFETEKLVEKENDLKNKLQEAEKILKSKGEKMYSQISQEIKILAAHFETMKKERDILDKEKTDLDNLKRINDKNDKVLEEYNNNKEELKSHYENLKEELDILKNYIKDCKESKCLVERGTVMEPREEKTLMNNDVNARSNDDILKYQVVNDFKKKNVNFNPLNQEVSRPSSSEADVQDCTCSETIQMLREENERLKKISMQHIEHINTLSHERNVLQQQVTRTRASPIVPHSLISNRIIQNPNTQSNRAGGEFYAFPHLQSRVLFPDEAVPFIGVLTDRRDDRRNLLNQWRALRRRRPASSPPTHATNPGQSIQSDPVCSFEKNASDYVEIANIQPSTSDTPAVSHKEKSIPIEKNMKPVLHETKQKQRVNTKDHPPPIRCEKSSNSTLCEAQLRLRKLEIEAEAVEKSYLEFKKRKSNLKIVKNDIKVPDKPIVRNMTYQGKPTKIPTKIKEDKKSDILNIKELPDSFKKDFDKYLREYQTKFDIAKLHFPNKNTILQNVKPIPTVDTSCDKIEICKNINYIETPISEFRKFYQKNNSNVTVDNIKQNVRDNSETVIKDLNKTKCVEQTDLLITEENNSNNNNTNNISKVLSDFKDDIVNQDIVKDTNNDYSKNDSEVLHTDSVVINDKEENNEDRDNHLELGSFNNQHSDENNETVKENTQNLEIKEIVDQNIISNDKVLQNEEKMLVVEIENVYNESNIKVSESKDLLVLVESSVYNELNEPKDDVISTQMTIIVSPKNKENEDKTKSKTIEKLTEKDILNDIFHAKNNEEVSSVELSKKLENSSKIENSDDYGEDFSADVDNYNSQYEFGNNSPISVAKTSDVDDDNFWDS